MTQDRPQSPVQPFSVRVTPAFRQQVIEAARAMVMPVSRWLRHVVQHVTPADFPDSWQPGAAPEGTWEDLARGGPSSHHSPYYTRRFIILVDGAAGRTLATMMQACGYSAAGIVCYLITHATPADIPPIWRGDS